MSRDVLAVITGAMGVLGAFLIGTFLGSFVPLPWGEPMCESPSLAIVATGAVTAGMCAVQALLLCRASTQLFGLAENARRYERQRAARDGAPEEVAA